MTRAKYRRLELQIRMSLVVTNQQNTLFPHLVPEAREGFDRRGYKFVPPYSVQRISAFSCGGLWTRLDFSGIIIVDESGFTEETNLMELKRIEHKLTVCKVSEISNINTDADFYFIGKTDEELSLVCRTEDTPKNTVERDDGWRCFRIQGVLDFSLIGVLSKLSGILAEHNIGIFAVSTYNTDYILVKEEIYDRALTVLASEGYTVV